MISIVIPTRNEEKSIGLVISEIHKEMNEEYEIIVVDSSSDKTPEIANSLGAKIIREERKGYGRAYKTGFSVVNGDIIVTLDGDDTYPVTEIPVLIEYLRSHDVDFISCDRITKLSGLEEMDKTHRLGNAILNFAFLMLYFHKIKDSQSGMWIFKKSLLKKMNLNADGMAFSEEIKVEALKNGKFIEIPIKYGIRKGQKKLNTFRDGILNLLFLIKKRFTG
ncbi:MAG: glycosyltransferase family 2 protein [Thermoplasmata archaeon]